MIALLRTLAVLVCVLLPPLSAKCQCTGQSQEQIYRGGDETPLSWQSLRNQLPTGQTVSYERTVENHSTQDVTDVYWPVAGYWKDLLPAKTPICDQTTIPGETDTEKGPLNYGPSSSAVYQTASYCPKSGWPSSKLTDRSLTMRALSSTKPLSSELQVAVRDRRGIAICTLHLKSAFTRDYEKRTTNYQYDLENYGPVTLGVFWDVPRTEQFERQFSMTMEEPRLIRAKDSASIAVEASQIAVAVASTVFIFDSNRKLVGRSIVGVWGAADGKTTTDLSKVWKALEK